MRVERASLKWQKNKLKEIEDIKDKINSSINSTENKVFF